MIAGNKYVQANRAALFDWIVLLTSFLMGFVFPSIKDIITSPDFSYWMLTALVLYIAGAALKHLPLSFRLISSSVPVKPVPYIILLLVGHWFIILFLVILAEPAIRTILQLPPNTKNNSASWQLISSAVIMATFVTWLVYRTKSKRQKRIKYSPSFLGWLELAADMLLIAGVAIFSFVFWEKGVMAMLARASTQTASEVWFLFVFLSILFLFFYLPLRYLYFVEDRQRGRNRRRLMMIFGFLIVKALIEMLPI